MSHRSHVHFAADQLDIFAWPGDANAVHRVGKLYPGDLAVWVGVLCGHRDGCPTVLVDRHREVHGAAEGTQR